MCILWASLPNGAVLVKILRLVSVLLLFVSTSIACQKPKAKNREMWLMGELLLSGKNSSSKISAILIPLSRFGASEYLRIDCSGSFGSMRSWFSFSQGYQSTPNKPQINFLYSLGSGSQFFISNGTLIENREFYWYSFRYNEPVSIRMTLGDENDLDGFFSRLSPEPAEDEQLQCSIDG